MYRKHSVRFLSKLLLPADGVGPLLQSAHPRRGPHARDSRHLSHEREVIDMRLRQTYMYNTIHKDMCWSLWVTST